MERHHRLLSCLFTHRCVCVEQAGPSQRQEASLTFPLVFYLSRVLELQHAGVVMRFACSGLCGADEVTQSFGHIFHCVNQDHL